MSESRCLSRTNMFRTWLYCRKPKGHEGWHGTYVLLPELRRIEWDGAGQLRTETP
jgi:hypothetical protein